MTELPFIAPGYEEETPCESTEGVLQNRCLLDQTAFTEAMRASMHTPVFRIIRAVELFLMALFAGLLIWALIDRAGTGPVLEAALFLAMVSYFYVYQLILLPRKLVKKQILHYADGDDYTDNEIYFFPANVGNRRSPDAELLHMDYARIKRVNESEHYIVLTTRANALVPLDKARFSNGGPAELWPLLREKAPGAKLYPLR